MNNNVFKTKILLNSKKINPINLPGDTIIQIIQLKTESDKMPQKNQHPQLPMNSHSESRLTNCQIINEKQQVRLKYKTLISSWTWRKVNNITVNREIKIINSHWLLMTNGTTCLIIIKIKMQDLITKKVHKCYIQQMMCSRKMMNNKIQMKILNFFDRKLKIMNIWTTLRWIHKRNFKQSLNYRKI